MKLSKAQVFALGSTFARLVHAGSYMFDQSCNSVPGMLDFVRGTFLNAITMSQAAYAATNPTVTDPAVAAVLASLVNPINPVQSTPVQFAQNIFGPLGVNRFTSEVADNNLLGKNDVKVYCDQTRFVQRALDSKWIDTDIMRDDVARIRCKARDSVVNPDDFALMYTTWNDERRDGDGNIVSGESFHQVQICPFFLQWALPFNSDQNTVTLAKGFWKKATIGLAQTILTATKYSPIDAVSLFDKVMLHELTHATTQDWVTIDVDTGSGPAYGWKLCTALSTSDSIANGAAQNADTWALFGSICWQLQQGLIAGVDADGKIIKV